MTPEDRISARAWLLRTILVLLSVLISAFALGWLAFSAGYVAGLYL